MFLGMAAVFFRIEVPDFILKPLSMISGVTSPLALVFIGSVIRNMETSSIRIGKDIVVAVLMRFIMVPATAVVFLRLLPVTQEMREGILHADRDAGDGTDGDHGAEYDRDYEFACTVITADNRDQHGDDPGVHVPDADVCNLRIEVRNRIRSHCIKYPE